MYLRWHHVLEFSFVSMCGSEKNRFLTLDVSNSVLCSSLGDCLALPVYFSFFFTSPCLLRPPPLLITCNYHQRKEQCSFFVPQCSLTTDSIFVDSIHCWNCIYSRTKAGQRSVLFKHVSERKAYYVRVFTQILQNDKQHVL